MSFQWLWDGLASMFCPLGAVQLDDRTDAEKISSDWHAVIHCDGCSFCQRALK